MKDFVTKKNILKLIFFLMVFAMLNAGVFVYAYKDAQIPSIFEHNNSNPGDKIKEKTVKIKTNKKEYMVRTQKEKVKDLVDELDIELSEEDFIYPELNSPLRHNSNVIINKKNLYYVKVDDRNLEHRSYEIYVKDILNEMELTLNESDLVEPALDEFVVSDSEIVITRVKQEELVIEEEIPFEVIEKEDADLDFNKTKLEQEGRKGIKEIKYLVTYEDDQEVDRKILEQNILKEPKDKIVVKGTKVRTGKPDRGLASWYAYTGKMACASLKHPKGTWLKVTNVENGKSVNVIVNDSGPYVEGRIIDLDKEAFKKIGNLGQGVIEVKVEKIKQ
ncbi:MAG: DUF348 domain-containing protein [Candidatus Moranbacteria bacterium]|nr:DUF348 domain-containing protein [Candidatus Moranbacteria bacterium]